MDFKLKHRPELKRLEGYEFIGIYQGKQAVWCLKGTMEGGTAEPELVIRSELITPQLLHTDKYVRSEHNSWKAEQERKRR